MYKRVPCSTIRAALDGDALAADAILLNYRGYILFLSQRFGYLDEEAVHRLQSKLLYAIFKFHPTT